MIEGALLALALNALLVSFGSSIHVSVARWCKSAVGDPVMNLRTLALLIALVPLAACGNGMPSRSTLLPIIQKAAAMQPATFTIVGGVGPCCRAYNVLRQQGLVSPCVSWSYTVTTLSPAGPCPPGASFNPTAKAFALAKRAGLLPGPQPLSGVPSLAIPIGEYTIEEITSVDDDDATHITAHFTCHITFNAAGKALLAADDPNITVPLLNSAYLVDLSQAARRLPGVASFVKSDTGWRLASIDGSGI